jgi:hypothetical protein
MRALVDPEGIEPSSEIVKTICLLTSVILPFAEET